MSVDVMEMNRKAIADTRYKTGDMSEPTVGEVFYDNGKSPWVDSYGSVTVIEVLEGYVRYNYNTGPDHLRCQPYYISIPDFMLNYCRADKV